MAGRDAVLLLLTFMTLAGAVVATRGMKFPPGSPPFLLGMGAFAFSLGTGLSWLVALAFLYL